jgi:hypothetical protein
MRPGPTRITTREAPGATSSSSAAAPHSTGSRNAAVWGAAAHPALLTLPRGLLSFTGMFSAANNAVLGWWRSPIG